MLTLRIRYNRIFDSDKISAPMYLTIKLIVNFPSMLSKSYEAVITREDYDDHQEAAFLNMNMFE